jgi:hypothetical protein
VCIYTHHLFFLFFQFFYFYSSPRFACTAKISTYLYGVYT